MNSALKIIFSFSLLLGIATANSKFRIIRGDDARIENYPHQVSMRWAFGAPQPQHFCGGSIVSETHIVTAAHCVDDKLTSDMTKFIKIYTGTSRTDTAAGEGNTYGVKKITMHPKYVGQSDYYLNDIAVVTLDKPIKFNNAQKAVKLPIQKVNSGETATVTGWGNTKSREDQNTPKILQKADMKVISAAECKTTIPYPLGNSQICAISSKGAGVCTGDSGGPLVSNGALVGVVSYVVDCAKGYPDVYTNVLSYVPFIQQAMTGVIDSTDNKKPSGDGAFVPNWQDQTGNGAFVPNWQGQTGNGAFVPNWQDQTGNGAFLPDYQVPNYQIPNYNDIFGPNYYPGQSNGAFLPPYQGQLPSWGNYNPYG